MRAEHRRRLEGWPFMPNVSRLRQILRIAGRTRLPGIGICKYRRSSLSLALGSRVQFPSFVQSRLPQDLLLNRSRSQMGIYDEVLEEVRDIHRSGTAQTNTWRRELRGGKTQQGSYDIVCDGAEHLAAGQLTECRVIAPDVMEGYIKTPGHKPPILLVSTVAGDVLTYARLATPHTHNSLRHWSTTAAALAS
jgi:hypothetical protein